MTPKQRINELIKRQRFDGSSMFVRLNAVDGKWFYSVILIVETDEKKKLPVGGKYGLCIQRKEVGEIVDATVDGKYVIMTGKYNLDDPEDLMANAEKIVGKWKCGKQVMKPMEIST